MPVDPASPTCEITRTETPRSHKTRKNRISKFIVKIKNTFKQPQSSKTQTAPCLPVPIESNVITAEKKPEIKLPSPTQLIPIQPTLHGIDLQLAKIHIARADNAIEKFDRTLAPFYGTNIEDIEENSGLISNCQALIKQRNAIAYSRNLYAQGKVHHRALTVQGPATQRAQKHVSRIEDAALQLDRAMDSLMQASCGRQPSPEIEQNYLGVHKALSEQRNAWVSGALDNSSKMGLKFSKFVSKLPSRKRNIQHLQHPNPLRNQLELNVKSEKLTFDTQRILFAPKGTPVVDSWSSTPFYALDSVSPPIATDTLLKIAHCPIQDGLDTRSLARIKKHVDALEKQVGHIDKRLEDLCNGRQDPLSKEQLLFIRNAMSNLRNSWADGELTESSSIGMKLKTNSHNLRRRQLEDTLTLAKELKLVPALPMDINSALKGQERAEAVNHVNRCDEALAEFDRAIHKANHTGIEGLEVSQNIFEARDAMMQLRNAWASGKLTNTQGIEAGNAATGPAPDHPRIELEHHVRHKSLIKLKAALPLESEATLDTIKTASKAKIIRDINHDLASAYLKIAAPQHA